jgi:glycerol-3-phosphate responsive antiterminator
MDDDTSAVVIVAGLLLIAVVGGHLAYQYVTTTSREPAIYRFKSNSVVFTATNMGLNLQLRRFMMDCLALESPYSECIWVQY